MTGPLAGVRVIEIASIGPGPFCAMLLGDLGAEVIRVERIRVAAPDSDSLPDPLQRNRSASIALDLKDPRGTEVLLRLVESADVLIEGFRPGVMERLGAGPDVCAARNPDLIYGRMTGWGQQGERATTAGHDIDFLAVSGVLHSIGDADRPPPAPLNVIADFGGGGMLLALGICAALADRRPGPIGQVIDAAMVDGASLLAAMFHGMRTTGAWIDARQSNLLDGAAPFYRCYRTSDDRFIAVGAIEPQFFAALLAGLEIDAGSLPGQYDRSGWPATAEVFASVIGTRPRDEWAGVFAGTDACVAPVLDLGEAAIDRHAVDRGAFVEVAGVMQPIPAPRFGGSSRLPAPPRPPGADTDRVLLELGYDTASIAAMRTSGVTA